MRRIEALWTDCRTRFGGDGPFLFGAFGAADAMYAPVVSRFQTYAIEVGPRRKGLYAGGHGLAGLARMAAAALDGALGAAGGRGRLADRIAGMTGFVRRRRSTCGRRDCPKNVADVY